ncbi:hypothetical protein Aglo01_41330 [Actinokineospora globicatena]|nr:hypothetical protein Aglo01_41330 [Actinokineospora globicatena]GLW85938.1 hypothetical protein Aglo02_35780 [Actinokineospora globicatena]
MAVPVGPRLLTASERAVVLRLLEADFVGVEELRAQVDVAEVVAKWGEESVSVDLRVPAGVTPSPVGNGPVPVRATVSDGDRGVVAVGRPRAARGVGVRVIPR